MSSVNLEHQIIHIVAKCCGVSYEEIMSDSRKHEITLARSIVVFTIRKYTTLSYPNIGKIIGRKHSTVYHSYVVICDLMRVDKSVKKLVESIEKKVELM